MTLQLTRSIYFRDSVRLGRAMGGANAQRQSVMLADGHYEGWVEEGFYAVIVDPRRHTKMRVSWDLVGTYELESDALEADATFAKHGPGETRAEKAAKEKQKAAAAAQVETDRQRAADNRAAEAEAKARAKAAAQAGA